MENVSSYPSGFHIRTEKQKESGFHWTPLLLTLLTVGSMGFCIQNVLYPEWNVILLVSTVLITGCLTAWISRNGRRLLAGLGVFLFLLLAVVVFGYSYWRAGGLDFLNRALLRYNYITGLAYDYYNTDFCPDIGMAAAVFWCFFLVCLTLYLGLMIILKHPVLLLCCWLPVIGGCIFLQVPVGSLVVACAVVSVVGTFAYSQMKLSDDRIYAMAILLLGVLLCLVSAVYFKKGAFHPNQTVKTWKEDTIAVSEKLRYGEQDSPQGKVSQQVSSSNAVRFQVSMSAPKKLYLKGFVGSVWNEGRWEMLPGKSYSEKYEGMIKGYTRRGFHPLAQQQLYLQMADQVPDAGMEHESIDVEVQNISAFRKYCYIPYGISYDSIMEIGSSNQDINMPGTVFDKGEDMIYQAVADTVPEDAMLAYRRETWLNAASDISVETGEYRIAEADYREFVHSYYLELSEEQKQEAEQEIVLSDRTDLLTMTRKIRDYLLAEGTEAGDWNTTDYSSAAVFLYRGLGIPARYAEGYIADAGQESAGADGRYHINVLAKDAHAWVELYKDGVGWIPVEVTPGFYHDINGVQQSSQQSTSAESEQAMQQEKEWEEETEEESESSIGFGWLLWILIVLAVLCILACLILYIRSRLIWKKRWERLAAEDIWLRLEQSAEILERIYHYKKWEEEELDAAVKRILNVYRFSSHPETMIGAEEVMQVQEYMQDMRQKIYQTAGRAEQWKLKYIEVI